MADASTSLYKLTKPEVGASADTWGGKLNTDFDSLDKLLGVNATTGLADAYALTTGQTLTAYATGQRFRVRWNFTNAGSATLNVDTIGAKTIKKRDAVTNCSASDLVSGATGIVSYDGTNFVLDDYVASDVQGNDSTLTAFAALAWSSGNPLVQFTAADTISLTLAPSVSSLTASQGAGATTPSATVTNTTNAASVRVASFAGARATPAINDVCYLSLYGNNASSVQKEMARFSWSPFVITAGAESAALTLGLLFGGALIDVFVWSAYAFRPNSNDGCTLGTAAVSFADLFLASDGVINWNNGNATLTHSAGLLTSSVPIKCSPPQSSETSGTLTAASANSTVNATGDITIDGNVFTAENRMEFYAGASSRVLTQGSTGSPTQRLHGTATTGNRTLAARGIAYVKFISATEWVVAGDVS